VDSIASTTFNQVRLGRADAGAPHCARGDGPFARVVRAAVLL
jgi:hypothetical protein